MTLNVLLIAPNAPPKNTAESIQVRRILAELDKRVSGRLVTVSPTSAWGPRDASLELPLAHFDTQWIDLPLHRFTSRVLISHRLKHFHVPDAMIWITAMAGRVLRALKTKPDIIYSRSFPLSAALLASKIQRRLGVPWVMHLSDPWAENPHGTPHPKNARDEMRCFQQAALITLTTQGQADYYRKKYPEFVQKIIVSPNVMPDLAEVQASLNHLSASPRDKRLRMVFAGNLYGSRSPESLMNAVDVLRATRPELLKKLRIDFYGQAQVSCLQMLARAADVIQYHGPVSFAQSYAEQQAADIALTIDAEMENPLSKYFLPCKVTDSLALGKPIFSITPDGSETARICGEGYGWSAAPSRPAEVAARIAELIEKTDELRAAPANIPPSFYMASTVAADLVRHMETLVRKNG